MPHSTAPRYATISVIGLGYIGLPTAAAFASRKLHVVGVDVNPRAVEIINNGQIHIVEPDLDIIVHAAVTQGYLRATTTPEPADAFLIAVPTPFKGEHTPDLSYVEAAARSIAPHLCAGNLVVLESTCPVGATEKLAAWLAEARPDLSFPQQCGEASDIRIAHCPERVLPGHVMRELVENHRVIGGMTPACTEVACSLYRIFVEGECLTTDARTAEMCKLTENAFRDVNIAFANELSLICDRLNISVWDLIRLANHHPRVNILQPGCGVGGHCIAVDPWFIVDTTPEQARLIRTAREVNDGKPQWVVERVTQALASLAFEKHVPIGSLTIACFGLAFKPDIDDLRESPALAITQQLAQIYPAQVLAVEPNVEALPAKLSDHQVDLVSQEEAFARADVLVLLVDHRPFKMEPPVLREGQRLIDTRGIWHS